MEDIKDVYSSTAQRYSNYSQPYHIEAAEPKYTWRGPLFHKGQRIYEKLDRVLSNKEWNMEFPDA